MPKYEGHDLHCNTLGHVPIGGDGCSCHAPTLKAELQKVRKALNEAIYIMSTGSYEEQDAVALSIKSEFAL